MKKTTLIIALAVLTCISTAFVIPSKWTIKSDTADIKFKIKNFGVTVEGSMGGLKGDITFDDKDLSSASIKATVDVSTINTGIEKRDAHLRNEDYFDVTKYPTISLASTKIEKSGEQFKFIGKLTLKATTREISFPFVFIQSEGKGVFRGEFEINREDYNLGSSGGTMGNTVTITLSVPVTKS